MRERHRILIVTDGSIGEVKSHLETDGFDVSGPYDSVLEALGRIPEEDFDLAIVDMDMRGDAVFPLIDTLEELELPYVLLVSPDTAIVAEQYGGRPQIMKPLDLTLLSSRVAESLQPLAVLARLRRLSGVPERGAMHR
jgi:DNA-binding response OmpR family regulator